MDNTDDAINSAAAAAAAAGSSMSSAYEEFTDEEDNDVDNTANDRKQITKSSKKTTSSKGKKRKRSDSTSDSSSSGSSSDSDDSSSGSDDNDEKPPPKKSKKKSSATATKKKKQTQQQKGGSNTTDDPINTLVEMAIKSQKKQVKNQMINSVETDVLSALQKRLNNSSTPPSEDATASSRTDKSLNEDGKTASKTLPKEYVKRIKQAYKEHEEGYDDSPKFNTKQHRKSINKLYGTIDQLNGVELLRIPYIDKEMGLHDFITKHGLDRKVKKLDKKTLSASPDKTIPEAEYAALRDAYSSCMLYKYFFTRLLPYVTVPYIQ